MYVPDAGYFKGISFLLGSVMVVMTLIGFLKRMIEGPIVTEWFFIFYTLMLLVFPNNSSAFRLMVPLGFLFLFYAATGLKTVTLIQNIPNVKRSVFIGVFIFLMFLPGLTKIARSGSNILDGPQQPVAIELFTYMQKHIPPNSIVVFTKPRALALYANCRGMVDPFTTDPTLIHKQVTDAKATHLLISDKLSSEAMKRYSRVMESRLTKLWENEEFTLFRINTANPLAPQ